MSGDEQTMAKLAAAAYVSDGNYDEHLKGTGYKVHPDKSFSDHNVTTFLHDNGDVAIMHRGTAVGSKGGSADLKADAMYALGKAGSNKKRFDDRMKKTEDIMKRSGASNFYLGGHSLGGGTAEHAARNSKVVREKVTAIHTFNQAANPLFKNKSNLTKEEKKSLGSKFTKHRIGGDVVSGGLRSRNDLGTVKKYDAKGKEGALSSHGIDQFIDNQTGRTTHVGKHRVKKKDRHMYDGKPQATNANRWSRYQGMTATQTPMVFR